MRLVKILSVLVFCLVQCCFVQAARGVGAESLDMLGRQCAGPVSSEATEAIGAYDDEGQKLKCRDLGSWSFDINALPEHLQAIFNTTAPITAKDLEELELELLKQADPTAYQYVLHLMKRANELVEQGQPNRASSLLRGFAGCVHADGLTELVLADKGLYKSPLGTMEIPFMPGATVKPGWPLSEVYFGNASLYAKGGPFEGYEPVLVDTRILAATGSTVASMACPVLGRVMGYAAACNSTDRIVKTVSAPFFARYHAHVKMGLSFEEFDKYFEEEVIKGGEIPGVPGCYSVTYRLTNKITGEVYEKDYNAGDVIAVGGTVLKAVKGIQEAKKAAATSGTTVSSSGGGNSSSPGRTSANPKPDFIGTSQGDVVAYSEYQAEVGIQREMKVAEMVGGRVAKDAKGLDMILRTPNEAPRVDVFGPKGEAIVVGGPAKAKTLKKYGDTVSKLHDLKRAAEYHGVRAMAFFTKDTPQKLLDKARLILGPKNVKLF